MIDEELLTHFIKTDLSDYFQHLAQGYGNDYVNGEIAYWSRVLHMGKGTIAFTTLAEYFPEVDEFVDDD